MDLADRGLLLDADEIARALDPENPKRMAIAAGRALHKTIGLRLHYKDSFAVETTLSGKSSLGLIRSAKTEGYEIHVIFVALDSPERCIERIRTRALQGGHFVPDADVRRRYRRSIAALPNALQAANLAKVYDKSGDGHQLILTIKSGVVISRLPELPQWARDGNLGA